jgi:hypothetical protein
MGKDGAPPLKKLKTNGTQSGTTSASAGAMPGGAKKYWGQPKWMNSKPLGEAVGALRIFHLALEALTYQKDVPRPKAGPGSGKFTRGLVKSTYSNLALPDDTPHHQALLKQYLGRVVEKYSPDVIVIGEYYRQEKSWKLNGTSYEVYSSQGAKKSTSNTHEFTYAATSDMTLLVKENAPVSRHMINFREWHKQDQINNKIISGGGPSGERKGCEDMIVLNKKARRVFATCISILSSDDKTTYEANFDSHYITPLKTYCEKLKALNQSTFADLISITYQNRNILFIHLPNEHAKAFNAPWQTIQQAFVQVPPEDNRHPFYDLIIGDLNLGGKPSKSAPYIPQVRLIKSDVNAEECSHIGIIHTSEQRIKVQNPDPNYAQDAQEFGQDLGLPVWIENNNGLPVNYLLGDHEGIMMDVESTTKQASKTFKQLVEEKLQWFSQNAQNLSNRLASDRMSAPSSAEDDAISIATSSATHRHLPSVPVLSLQLQKFKNFEEQLKKRLQLAIPANDTFFALVAYLKHYEPHEITAVVDEVINSPALTKYFT